MMQTKFEKGSSLRWVGSSFEFFPERPDEQLIEVYKYRVNHSHNAKKALK
jgi:hypothetical protein